MIGAMGVIESAIAAQVADNERRYQRAIWESRPKRLLGPTKDSLEDPTIADAWNEFRMLCKIKGYEI